MRACVEPFFSCLLFLSNILLWFWLGKGFGRELK